MINGIYGLGEFIVQGEVIPDEFIVFKPILEIGNKDSIIGKNIGKKNIKLIYAKEGTKKRKYHYLTNKNFVLPMKKL